MKWTLCFLTCVLLLGAGCAKEREEPDVPGSGDTATVTQSVTHSDRTTPFDLASVQRDYRDRPLEVLDISERTLDGRNALAVTLSVPLNPAEDHSGYFNVSRRNGELVDGGWILSASGKIVWFPHIEPNTAYDVTVYPGLTAGNSQALAVKATATVHSRNLVPSVNFDTNGAFLTAGLGNGLPVVTVNVTQVNIDFFRIKENQLNHFLRQINRHHNYYWNTRQLTRFGELVYSGRYDLDAPPNTLVKRTIDVSGNGALESPGVYLAVMLPAGEYQKKQVVWFAVTDLGLHVRQYAQQLDVHVSSLQSGKPLAAIKVSLWDGQSNVISESRTSPDGLASFSASHKKARLIIAQSGTQFSVLQTRRPALDLSEFDLGQRPQLPMELFVYTPRDLFRPGEVVDFNGLLRDGDGRPTQATVLQASIRRPDGSVIKRFRWQPQRLSYYHQAWQIPSDAPLGRWELVVTGALPKPVIYPFKVEAFLPERMKLVFNKAALNKAAINSLPPNNTASAQRIVVAPSEDLKVPVLGEYLYGAPASGNRLSTIVNLKPWRNPVEALENYEFGHITEPGLQQQFNLQDLYLDKGGQSEILVSSRWQEVRSPLQVRLISSLYESGGRPVTRVYSALMWPAEALIGIRSSFGEKNPAANSRVSFDIVKATLQGELRAANQLDVQLIREDRQYFWVYNENRGWHYEWTDKEFAEVSQTLNITQGNSVQVEFPVSYGSYRLEVRDPSNGLTSSLRFYAGHNWYADWQAAQAGSGAARPDRIQMALDQAHYRAGDIARVTVVPPEAGEALVMVEGDGPLWMQRLSLPADGATLKIPIDKHWRQHNLYITALALRPGNHKQAITPKRSYGLIHLPLDRSHRRLDVSIEVPDKVLPEKTLEVALEVKPSQPDSQLPDEVYLTLAAVDVGVLSINNFQTPDPHRGFFGRRRYAVENRDIYDQVIEVSHATKARLRFGGDADLTRGGKEPQAEVQIVSLFNGPVAVQAGKARVPLQIPDFNGRLRLMALAFSADSFGHGSEELTVAAPVVTQLATPRFLALGDRARVALDINNLSGNTQTLEIELASEGPVTLVDGKRTINLHDREKSTLLYDIEATDYSGQAEFTLQVTGSGFEPMERLWRLGVRPAYPALIKQQSVLLKPGESFALDGGQIEGLLPNSVEALVSVSARAHLNLQSQLQNLLAYPYGCLEQTSSRAFPLTYATPEMQRRLGLKQLDEVERLKMIEQGIDRLASMQLANGGFGLWSNSSPEEHWLTAFVADFLLSAREMGVEVPADLIDKTMSRLKHYVNRGGRFVGERWSQDSNHYSFAYKAYAAYVLSRVGQAPLGSLRNLFDNQLQWAKSGLPQAHLGIALIRMGDQKRGRQAMAAAVANLPERRHYYGDYGSGIRDMAMLIHLLIEHDIDKNQAFSLSFELAKRLQGRRWLSTQERNALFLAGLSLESQQADNWQAQVFLGAVQEHLDQQTTYRKWLDGEQIQRGLRVQTQHDKPLFVSASISGYGEEKPTPTTAGLSITRTWYTTDGHAVVPHEVRVGELYIAHLEVTAEERTPDALVVDLLPAGFELENQNLDTAIKLDEFRIDDKTFEELSRHTQLKHREYRDDRFVAALDLNGYRSAHVFYLVRAVTPGTYKVPSPLVEDMYRAERRGVGDTLEAITINNIRD